MGHGGGGGGRRWDQDYWVSPLPPRGDLTFACEWPAKGVSFRRVDIDAGEILEAVPRAQNLWPEGTTVPENWGGWTDS
jgi:hypothetical protein